MYMLFIDYFIESKFCVSANHHDRLYNLKFINLVWQDKVFSRPFFKSLLKIKTGGLHLFCQHFKLTFYAEVKMKTEKKIQAHCTGEKKTP